MWKKNLKGAQGKIFVEKEIQPHLSEFYGDQQTRSASLVKSSHLLRELKLVQKHLISTSFRKGRTHCPLQQGLH